MLIKDYADMRTGDLGRSDDTGKVSLIGRIGHVINIRGYKIHPIEIERIAMAFASSILEARASPHEVDGDVRTQLELVVVDGGSFDEAELRQALQRSLPLPLVPARITYHQALQRTEIGSKIIRQRGS